MPLTVLPVDALFPVSTVDGPLNTAARQHAHDEAKRRRQRQAANEMLEAENLSAAPSDPDSHPTTGTLFDVKV